MTYNDDILNRIAANDPTLLDANFETEKTLDETYLEALKAALEKNTYVRSLVFLQNYINDETVKIISSISCSALKHVSLQRNNISDKGAASLASMRLYSINLSYNQISDEGAIAFANTSCKEVDISFNSIKNSGVIALLRNSSIENLNIEGNNFDNEGVNQVFSNKNLIKFKCRNQHISREFYVNSIQPHIKQNESRPVKNNRHGYAGLLNNYMIWASSASKKTVPSESIRFDATL